MPDPSKNDRPLAPYWLPQQQRRFLDRVLNNLIKRGACSICGNAWKSNSHTAYGLDAQSHVVVAGTCCIAKIVELMGYGFFGRGDSPDDLRELMREHSARDWKIEDRVWFNEHPARSHRARIPFPGEDCLPDAKPSPGCAPINLVRQYQPGARLRRGFDLDANMVPITARSSTGWNTSATRNIAAELWSNRTIPCFRGLHEPVHTTVIAAQRPLRVINRKARESRRCHAARNAALASPRVGGASRASESVARQGRSRQESRRA
jgi:hypothetical protein